jgi:hypothetical protein
MLLAFDFLRQRQNPSRGRACQAVIGASLIEKKIGGCQHGSDIVVKGGGSAELITLALPLQSPAEPISLPEPRPVNASGNVMGAANAEAPNSLEAAIAIAAER